MSKVLSVSAPPLAPISGSVRAVPSLRLQFAAGWALAGALNLVIDLLPGLGQTLGGVPGVVARAVDFGRHLGFGLLSVAALWVFERWVPAARTLGWLAFALFSLTCGALFLPTDLDGLAERSAESLGISADLASAIVLVLVAGAIPVLAWLTLPRAWAHPWPAWALRALCALGALGAFFLNVSISPGNNPSAHLYLSWLAAIFAGNALPRWELWAVPPPGRRGVLLGIAALLVVGALWAFFGAHSNSVMIRLARRPSSLHLLAVLRGDGGFDNLHATLAARAGPFFSSRGGLPAIAPSRPTAPPEAPIVVLFSIDSLRSDVLADANNAVHLPHLRALAQAGVQFTQARAPGSMTKYTLGAISSGKYFSQQYWSGSKNRWPHEDSSIHLASALSAGGVYTAAFPATEWLENANGVVRGFERNQHEGERLPGTRWIDGRSLTAQLLASLEANRDRAGFYWVHYLDSHEPYFRGGKGRKFERYLRSLSHVDGYLGELRAAIVRLGLAERALVLVVSDHGEAFGDHDTQFHGNSLYDELLLVPLLAVGSDVVARPIDVPVSLIDLGPTILDWFGVPTPASFMGESLVPLLRGQRRGFSRPIVAETALKQAMLFDDGYKVIRDLRRNTLELYDLKTDAGELNNLSDQVDPEHDEHVLLLRSFFQAHTYRENGYRVPYVK